jgi:DNA repair protein RadC
MTAPRKYKTMYQEIKISVMELRETEAQGEAQRGPQDVFNFCKDMSRCAQEQFVVLTYDTKSKLIDRHMVALGTLNSTLVHPREVFRPAIIDAAAQIVVVHNHPSGDPSPSAQDIRITKKLIEAARLIEIPLLDHVIIGRPDENNSQGFLSLRETGLCEFDAR